MKEKGSVIGPTVVIRGELHANQEPLTIMGAVEGVIDHDQLLSIRPEGRVDADVRAQEIVVEGAVKGNIHGLERVRIADTGRVEGNIYSRLFSVDEGAVIKGSVVMEADAEAVSQRFRAKNGSAEGSLGAARPASKAGSKKTVKESSTAAAGRKSDA